MVSRNMTITVDHRIAFIWVDTKTMRIDIFHLLFI